MLASRGLGGSRLSFYGEGEEAVVEQLGTPDFEVRLRVLNRLRLLAAEDPQWFRKWRRKVDLVGGFAKALGDRNWEVQHQAAKFLADSLHSFGEEDLAWALPALLPALVPKLASPKITVRRVTGACLLAAAKEGALHALLALLAKDCLTPGHAQLSEVLRELPALFAVELRRADWGLLLSALVRLLPPGGGATGELAQTTLERLHDYVGEDSFDRSVGHLGPQDRAHYEAFLARHGGFAAAQERSDTRASDVVGKQQRFGIVPISLYEIITSESADSMVKCTGLEQLKQILENLKESEKLRFEQHAFPFINLLSNILDELNFKVVVATLDVLRVSVSVLGRSLSHHLSQVVKTLGKHMGNQKSVLRQLNMMTVMELATAVGPKAVLAALLPSLHHRNSRVREEALNMVTALLLAHPSNAVNVGAVAVGVAPTLADPRRRVRLAAFELASVLAQALGPGRLEPLLRPVRDLEANSTAPGLLTAIQARLARHQMPKIRYDGLVEYSLPSGGPEALRGAGEEMADVHWIMSAGAGPGSALSRVGRYPGPPASAAQPRPSSSPDAWALSGPSTAKVPTRRIFQD